MSLRQWPSLARRDVLQRAAVVVLGAPLWPAGCRSGRPEPVDFSERSHNFLPDDYRSVFDRWTRHARLVLATEGTVIEVWATLKGWEFREAYLEKYAQAYSLNPQERAALRAAELEKARSFYDLHLSVQTTDQRWNDLHKRDSPWRVSLRDGTGDVIYPTDLDRLKLPLQYEMVFFPERTAFTRAYGVRFERPESTESGFTGPVSGELTLQVSGPLGSVEATWDAK